MNLIEIVRKNEAEFNREENGLTYFTIPFKDKIYEFPVKLKHKDYCLTKTFLLKHIRSAVEEGTFVEYVEKEQDSYNYIPEPSYQLPLTPELAKELREILLEAVGDTRAEYKFQEVLENLKRIENGESVGYSPAFA